MNIEKANSEFLRFVNKYDLTFPKMKRKLEHSYRVMKNSEQIAKSLNLNENQIEIAIHIGLLHDIGHFEEIRVKDILKEKCLIDHGDYGVEILQKDNYIREFIDESKYDNIIFKAIKNHNKYNIEEGLSNEEILFAKIIRDADKLDIFYEGAEMFWNDEEQKEEINNSTISDEMINLFSKHIYMDRNLAKTKADSVVHFIALLFDINFKYDFEVIVKEDFINKILNKFSFKDEATAIQIQRLRQIAIQYSEEKANIDK